MYILQRTGTLLVSDTARPLLIPCSYNSTAQFARTRSSTVGTHRLSQDQFAGRGDLAARLLKKRAAQVSRERPRRNETRQPQTPASGGAEAAPPSTEAQAAEKAVKSARRNAKKAQKEEPKVLAALPNKTDLTALFMGSSPVTPRKLAPRTYSAISKLTLERISGDYSRYLGRNFGRRPGESTLKAIGPAGYARLALARVHQVSPRQQLKTVNIINSMIGTSKPASGRSVHAS